MIKAKLHHIKSYKSKGKLYTVANALPPKPLILLLQGSATERGEQLANLLYPYFIKYIPEWEKEMQKKIPHYFNRFYKSEYLIDIWNNLRLFIPKEQLLEIECVARFFREKLKTSDSNIFIKFHLLSILVDMANKKNKIKCFVKNEALYKCCSFAVWGKQTINNSFIFGRTLDVNLKFSYLQQPIIIVRVPDKGYQTFMISFLLTPFINFLGFNEKKVCIGHIGAPSIEETLEGNLWCQFIMDTLQTAATLDDAADCFKNYKSTHGINFVIGDGKQNGSAIAIETNAISTKFITHEIEKNAYHLTEKGEKKYYGLPLSDSIYHTDFTFDYNIRKKQYSVAANGPAGPSKDNNPVTSADYKDIYYPIYSYINKRSGLINDEDCLQILRIAANRKENLLNVLLNMNEESIYLNYFSIGSGSLTFAYEREFLKINYKEILNLH